MTEILVSVTAEDIARGKRDDCNRCPVALAVMRATGEPDVWATGDMVAAGRVYRTPEVVRRFVEDFDGGAEVRPFAFTLPEAAP